MNAITQHIRVAWCMQSCLPASYRNTAASKQNLIDQDNIEISAILVLTVQAWLEACLAGCANNDEVVQQPGDCASQKAACIEDGGVHGVLACLGEQGCVSCVSRVSRAA
eukprot:scaffold49315_cov18-Tisochrysis_lutea.AAC.2